MTTQVEGQLVLKNEEGQKWINLFLFIVSSIAGFALSKFTDTLLVWFDLETKFPSSKYWGFIVGIITVILTWMYIAKREDIMNFLYLTYDEMTKVVFTDRNQALKLSLVVIFWVAVIGLILSFFDMIAQYLLNLIMKI